MPASLDGPPSDPYACFRTAGWQLSDFLLWEIEYWDHEEDDVPGPPYSAGQKLLAADLNGVWTDYSGSIAWTGSTTNPTVGNGTIVARWTYVHAHLVVVNVKFTAGSTSTKGSGTYSFSLPVAATAADAKGATGAFWINDSGSALRTGSVVATSTTTVAMVVNAAGANVGSTTLLGTFTSSSLSLSFQYEV